MPTRLHFEKGHTLTVDEDASVVEAAFQAVTPNPAAVVKLTKNDRKMFVNVTTVRYFHEYKQGKARGFSG